MLQCNCSSIRCIILENLTGDSTKENIFSCWSYVYDEETGLYYLQSRYYNPEWGRFLNADALVSTGGLLGNNMFVYCGNNPVTRYDPTGTSFIQVDYRPNEPPDALFVTVTCGSASCGLFGNNTVSLVQEKVPITERTGTATYGLSFSASGGHSFSFAVGITFDNRGNVGFVFTYGAGVGSPSAGFSLFQSRTNAPTIKDQTGAGLNIGGSASFCGVSAGAEYNALLAGNNTYHGYTVSAGIGVGLPAEGHGYYSQTIVADVFNFYEAVWGIVFVGN